MSSNDESGHRVHEPVEETSSFRPDFRDSVQTPGPSTRESAAADTRDLPAGSAFLVVKRGPNAGSRFLLEGDVTSVGRHPDSDILLDDTTVSRQHVEFHRGEDGEFLVTDLGSLNGTYLNRQPIDEAVLAAGDEVQIGKFRLVFLTSDTVTVWYAVAGLDACQLRRQRGEVDEGPRQGLGLRRRRGRPRSPDRWPTVWMCHVG